MKAVVADFYEYYYCSCMMMFDAQELQNTEAAVMLKGSLTAAVPHNPSNDTKPPVHCTPALTAALLHCAL